MIARNKHGTIAPSTSSAEKETTLKRVGALTQQRSIDIRTRVKSKRLSSNSVARFNYLPYRLVNKATIKNAIPLIVKELLAEWQVKKEE